MKRISKILSVLMVAVMLFSFAAVPASALAHDSEATIKYVFKDSADGNVITKAEKGQVVWMYVVLNWNKNVLNFQGTFKWDKSVLTLVRKNGSTNAITGVTQTYNICGDFTRGTWIEMSDADGDMFYQDDDNNMMGGYTTYGAGTKTFNHDCNIASWDAAKKAQYQAYTFIFTSNQDVSTNQLLVNTKGEDLEFLQLCFKVNDDTDLTEAVISTDEAFETMNIIDITDDQSWYFAPYIVNDFETHTITPTETTLTIGGAPVVYHLKNQIQWADKDAGTVNLGVVAGFKESDIGITFNDAGRSENVSAVGAELAINGVPVDGKTERFVYETTKDGEKAYNFRIVLANVNPADNAKYTVTPYVIYNGETLYGDAIDITDAMVDSYVARLS